MEFTTARSADLGRVRNVLMTAFDEYVRAMGRELNDDSFAGLADAVASGQVWVARTPQYIAGVVVAQSDDSNWQIDEIAVAPESQGRGVGTFLLQSIEATAQSSGAETLTLYTAKIMERLIALYQSHGYIVFKEGLPTHSRDSHVRVYMRKVLG